jgi:hypothetical protein
MSSWFKGATIALGLRDSDEQIALDRMLADYARQGRGHADTVDGIKLAMRASPDLKARMLEAVREGDLTGISDRVPGGGEAEYNAHAKTIGLRPGFDPREGDAVALIFTLGHEIEHARASKGVHYPSQVLEPSIRDLAREAHVGPRDYTPIVALYVERTRAEEGRAHIGGFNAVASYVRNLESPSRARLLETLHDACPGRMGDFIVRGGQAPAYTYALKDGLTIDPATGAMAYSRENIGVMKVEYADRARLGEDHLNYRQDCIRFGWERVHAAETAQAQLRPDDRREYTIDFTALQTDRDAVSLRTAPDTVLRPPADAAPIVVNEGLPPMEQLPEGLLDGIVLEVVQVPALQQDPVGGLPPPALDQPAVDQPDPPQPDQQQPSGPQPPDPSASSLPRVDPPLPEVAPSSVALVEARPEHPLFAQALRVVEGLQDSRSPETSLGTPEERRNLAAALAFAAHDRRLEGIERIVPSVDGTGMIVSQGDGDLRRNADVVLATALRTPERESLERLSTAVALQAASHAPSQGLGQDQSPRSLTM